jgi:hypothetical protein
MRNLRAIVDHETLVIVGNGGAPLSGNVNYGYVDTNRERATSSTSIDARTPGTALAHGSPEPDWAGYRGIDRAYVLSRISDLFADVAPTLTAAERLTAVSETLAPHLAVATVVFFSRRAEQIRSLAWCAPSTGATEALAARERVWRLAADLVEYGARLVEPGGGKVASASIEDPGRKLSGILYVESRRTLDGQDRWLVDETLRRMVLSRASLAT